MIYAATRPGVASLPRVGSQPCLFVDTSPASGAAFAPEQPAVDAAPAVLTRAGRGGYRGGTRLPGLDSAAPGSGQVGVIIEERELVGIGESQLALAPVLCPDAQHWSGSGCGRELDLRDAGRDVKTCHSLNAKRL